MGTGFTVDLDGSTNQKRMNVSRLSPFEKKTIGLGWAGFALGVLSLFAACAASYFVYQQFQEMGKQTRILNASLEQAKSDSKSASEATSGQLTVMQEQLREQQGQLTQQRDAMKLDQRAWVSLDHYELRAFDDTQSAKTFGQAFAVLRNTGKTAALSVQIIRGAFLKDSGSPNEADGRWMDMITRKVEEGAIGPNGPGIAPKSIPRDKWDQQFLEAGGGVIISDELAPPDVVGRFLKTDRLGIVAAPKRGTLGAMVPQADPLKVPVGLPSGTLEGVVVVVYGTVFYDDIFGKRHRTDFCGVGHGGVPVNAFNTYSLHGEWTDFTDCAVHNKLD
jgi:hypothetical protein